MNILSSPSPNFDDRATPISLLMMHYTGMETGAAALARMCDPDAKVAAHYMVEEDGQVHQLVPEGKRAWHAGVSEWAGQTDINSASIGIEIVNGGHDHLLKGGALPPYPDVQINAVIAVSKEIMKRHKLSPLAVVGHSDVAPERKVDPGEHFPWAGLAAAGVGMWPEAMTDDRRVLFESESRDRGVAIVQRGLAHIGYGARVTGVLDTPTRLIVAALQRRFRPDQIDGVVDIQTMDIIKWWAEQTSAGAAA